MRLPALAFAFLALPALGQEAREGVIWSLRADLDGQFGPEEFRLVDGLDPTSMRLLVAGADTDVWISGEIAWRGAMAGTNPFLQLAPNGSVQIVSMNDSIGRNRWETVLTIAFRSGTYRVAGYTTRWRDTLNLSAYGVCDVNLLTGKGERQVGDGPVVSFTTSAAALPIESWVLYESEPVECAS